MKQLRDVEVPLANFLASGVLRLEEKMGPLLWQFAPRRRLDVERFERFLDLLPHDTFAASRLAENHDGRLDGRASYDVTVNRRIRHAFEIRHESFMTQQFMDLLKSYNAALVFSDAADDWPYAEDITSDFIYIRLHGAEETYASGYGDAALDMWARKIGAWSRGTEPRDSQRAFGPAQRRNARDVFVYFDNDRKVRAPFDALELAKRLRNDWKDKHGG
jgi:uncharacterized protein YecE (DUF72 family)